MSKQELKRRLTEALKTFNEELSEEDILDCLWNSGVDVMSMYYTIMQDIRDSEDNKRPEERL